MTKLEYMVVIERGPRSFGAYVPDLPGCVAVGETADEVLQEIRKAIAFHLEGMIADGDPIPPLNSSAHRVDVDLATA
jgi:predicted RNase H-like HicB family nuclease